MDRNIDRRASLEPGRRSWSIRKNEDIARDIFRG
jgi:hypothetical protein